MVGESRLDDEHPKLEAKSQVNLAGTPHTHTHTHSYTAARCGTYNEIINVDAVFAVSVVDRTLVITQKRHTCLFMYAL